MFSLWLFLPLITLQLYLGYNENKTGYRHFSSIENTNLIDYNLYYFISSSKSVSIADKWHKEVYENSNYKNKNFKEQNVYLRKVATEQIKKSFFNYTFYHIYTAIRGTFDPGRFDIMTFFKKENGKEGFLEALNKKKSIFDLFKSEDVIFYAYLLAILVLNIIKYYFSFKFLYRNKYNYGILYTAILSFFYIFITGPVNCSRYMMPFQIVFICLCFAGYFKKELKN